MKIGEKLNEKREPDGFVQVNQDDLCSGVYIIGRGDGESQPY